MVEEKPGKVRQIAGTARFYFKPSMGRIIIRKSGVTRRSDKVEERNKAFRAWAEGKDGAVVKCRGKPWSEFIKCLKEMAETGKLGTGASKKAEYRQKFWRIK